MSAEHRKLTRRTPSRAIPVGGPPSSMSACDAEYHPTAEAVTRAA
ncbi:hypothetical protein [Nocardia beijingensis]|uniref:Uncharacterized protein n=1 Tax=Nocardia beijingensis TaxID=95162 RepID=A0ABW7WHE1_9NOCA